jgi:hypothetical protein
MSTVGYGDNYPKSIAGRLLGTVLCMWGVLLTSLFVLTTTNSLKFNESQKKSFTVIERLDIQEKMRKKAALCLSSMFKYKLTKVKEKKMKNKG